MEILKITQKSNYYFSSELQRIKVSRTGISAEWLIDVFDGIEKRIVRQYMKYLCSVEESINYARTMNESSCFEMFTKWAEHKNPLKEGGQNGRNYMFKVAVKAKITFENPITFETKMFLISLVV